MAEALKAPFPWFGGKSRVAPLVWEWFGDVANYVEPFFGSGAVLLGRPHAPGTETVNDKDGFLANAWRAISADPDGVAMWADWPVNENDLHARHAWLKPQRATLSARLEGDPDYFDAKIAGWWLWGMACWIGGRFCAKDGPWVVVDGELRNVGGDCDGTERKCPHLGNAGRGIARQLPHLGNAGRGTNRGQPIYEYMRQLQERMRRVRVCCGEWSRICGPSVTERHGLTGVFLDPPYSAEADRDGDIYAEEDLTVAHDVRRWAIENQDNPLLRIALCGYEGEHELPGWDCVAWKAHGGYGGGMGGRGEQNRHRERIWFSPNCLNSRQQCLFEEFAEVSA